MQLFAKHFVNLQHSHVMLVYCFAVHSCDLLTKTFDKVCLSQHLQYVLHILKLTFQKLTLNLVALTKSNKANLSFTIFFINIRITHFNGASINFPFVTF